MFLVENVEDLLQLSHEYQVKQLIFDPSVKFLEDQPKTKENVMKILALAKLYDLEKVHQGCIDLLKNMRLESLSETVHLQDLDKEKSPLTRKTGDTPRQETSLIVQSFVSGNIVSFPGLEIFFSDVSMTLQDSYVQINPKWIDNPGKLA